MSRAEMDWCLSCGGHDGSGDEYGANGWRWNTILAGSFKLKLHFIYNNNNCGLESFVINFLPFY